MNTTRRQQIAREYAAEIASERAAEAAFNTRSVDKDARNAAEFERYDLWRIAADIRADDAYKAWVRNDYPAARRCSWCDYNCNLTCEDGKRFCFVHRNDPRWTIAQNSAALNQAVAQGAGYIVRREDSAEGGVRHTWAGTTDGY